MFKDTSRGERQGSVGSEGNWHPIGKGCAHMYECEGFVYLDVQKTGSTSIRRFLDRVQNRE